MSRAALRGGPSTAAPGDGSRTLTITNDPTREIDEHGGEGDEEGDRGFVGSIRLRGGRRRTQAHVVWGEDVVDNEGCGKKKSKSNYTIPHHLSTQLTRKLSNSMLHLPQTQEVRRIL